MRSYKLLATVPVLSALALTKYSTNEQEKHTKFPLPAIVVHGGYGKVDPRVKYDVHAALVKAVRQGMDQLQCNKGPVDAVVEAVRVLEDSPFLNAGKGSVLTWTGRVENDASIMSGVDLKAGSVAAVTGVRNPIEGARAVMRNTPHVQLAGERAVEWLRTQSIRTEPLDYFITIEKRKEWRRWLRHNKIRLDPGRSDHLPTGNVTQKHGSMTNSTSLFGTVGAVAIDREGNIAAGTSTGGLMGKMPGRVGDSAGVGHGVYADNNSVGISCTGVGETFMRVGVARLVSWCVSFGMAPAECLMEALKSASALGGEGGAVAISRNGDIAVEHTAKFMAWCKSRAGKVTKCGGI